MGSFIALYGIDNTPQADRRGAGAVTRPRAASVLRDFLANEAMGGILLIAAAALAMIAANSGLAGAYFGMLHYETGPCSRPRSAR